MLSVGIILIEHIVDSSSPSGQYAMCFRLNQVDTIKSIKFYNTNLNGIAKNNSS